MYEVMRTTLPPAHKQCIQIAVIKGKLHAWFVLPVKDVLIYKKESK